MVACIVRCCTFITLVKYACVTVEDQTRDPALKCILAVSLNPGINLYVCACADMECIAMQAGQHSCHQHPWWNVLLCRLVSIHVIHTLGGMCCYAGWSAFMSSTPLVECVAMQAGQHSCHQHPWCSARGRASVYRMLVLRCRA